MLRKGKIVPWLLDDPHNRITARSVVDLFEASAAASDCESFGLFMAESRDFASLGPVSVLLNHLPTMRDIVECFIEYRILISDILNIALVDDGVNASNSNFACIPDRDSAASALAKTAINRFNGFVRYAPEGRAGC